MSEHRQSDNEHVAAFRDAMREAGLPYLGDIEGDSVLHRIYVEGDRRGSKNGWYVLHLDERPAGMFGTKKGDTRHVWTAKGLRPLTDEEREQLRRDARAKKAAAKEAEEARWARAADMARTMWDAAKEAVSHPYLTQKGVEAYGLRIGDWIKERKEDGKIYVAARNALLVPLMRDKNTMASLQAVFAEPIKTGEALRDKDFVYGGRKEGCYHLIGKPTEVDGQSTLVFVEGYATGASVHKATGLAVVVCFDAGNLRPVVERFRAVLPAAQFVIAADNDQWTHKPGGELWNPGVEKATAAGEAFDCIVVTPWFSDISCKPTDWNDLETQAGRAEVKRQFQAALPKKAVEPTPTGISEHPDALPEILAQDVKPLGHDGTNAFFYKRRQGMVVSVAQAQMNEQFCLTLSTLHRWDTATSGNFTRKIATDLLMRAVEAEGYYNPTTRRGRGFTLDAGRVIFHHGSGLIADGKPTSLDGLTTRFVYERGPQLTMPAEVELSDAEGALLRAVATSFSWRHSASGLLTLGWAVTAMACGALDWRPHIWVTGGPGSGKTTVAKKFLKPLLMGNCHHVQGSTTEAGTRQTMKCDALPVLFDEAEQDTEHDAFRMQSVIKLARQSSSESGAAIVRGTQSGRAMEFNPRGSFAFFSVKAGIHLQQDRERITPLHLIGKEEQRQDPTAWRRVMTNLNRIDRDGFASKLLARIVAHLPTLLENIETYSQAAAEVLGSQRLGDQIGTLMAGAAFVTSNRLATYDEALATFEGHDWSVFRPDAEEGEATSALRALLQKIILTESGSRSIEELILGVVRHGAPDLELRRRGMKIAPKDGVDCFWIAPRHNEVLKLVAGTPHQVALKDTLARIPGAIVSNSTSFQTGGKKLRAVILPLDEVIGDRDNGP